MLTLLRVAQSKPMNRIAGMSRDVVNALPDLRPREVPTPYMSVNPSHTQQALMMTPLPQPIGWFSYAYGVVLDNLHDACLWAQAGWPAAVSETPHLYNPNGLNHHSALANHGTPNHHPSRIEGRIDVYNAADQPKLPRPYE